MPRGDGTGPPTGGGSGRGRGTGMGGSRKGRGRMGGSRANAGPGGECICPQCGTMASHEVGIPCYYKNCPKCGAKMVRK